MADLEGMTFAELSAIDPAELSVDELAVLKRRMKDLAFEKIRAANVVQDAKIADEHVFIRPNSDPFFYLSFLCELEAQGGVMRERAAARAAESGAGGIWMTARRW